MHSRNTLVILGSLFWIASEALEVASGGLTPVTLGVTALAFGTLAAGAGVLRSGELASVWARRSQGVLALGFALMTILTLQMMAVGASQHEEGLLFASAIGTFTAGVLATGASMTAQPDTRGVGVLFTLTGLLALAGNAAEIAPVAHVGNVGLSMLLAWLARPATLEVAAA